MPGHPRQFPGQSPWQTKSGQGTDTQLLGRPFFEQYGSLLPVGNRRRLNRMEPLRECVSTRTSELRWGRLLTCGSYDLVITEASLGGFMLHRRLEFPSCVLDEDPQLTIDFLDLVSVVLIFNKRDALLDVAKSASENHNPIKLRLC